MNNNLINQNPFIEIESDLEKILVSKKTFLKACQKGFSLLDALQNEQEEDLFNQKWRYLTMIWSEYTLQKMEKAFNLGFKKEFKYIPSYFTTTEAVYAYLIHELDKLGKHTQLFNPNCLINSQYYQETTFHSFILHLEGTLTYD